MTQRPNVIFIVSDQQRTDTLGCYGAGWMRTPHLDRLAQEGVRCERAYCTNPVCAPSRASIFSGQMVSRHGAWNVGTVLPSEVPMVSEMLLAGGYRTHYVGKAHFQPGTTDPADSMETVVDWQGRYPAWQGPYYGFETVELAMGHGYWGVTGHYGAWVRAQGTAAEFEQWLQVQCLAEQPFGGEAYDWNLPYHLHSSVWTADRAVDFLQQQSHSERPFFMAIGFQDPHHPHGLPQGYPRRLTPGEVPAPAYTPGELADKPPHFLWARNGQLDSSPARGEYHVAGQGAGHDYRTVSEADARLGRSYYYGMVELMDEQIGRILACLDATGQTDNTLLIFTTDHGELLGDHGLWMKGPFHYEQILRVPLLLRWPRGLPAGQTSQQIVSLCDLAPTALDAAGLGLPSSMDGLSALPALRGNMPINSSKPFNGGGPVRTHALAECIDDPRGLRLKTMITPRHKLTRYADASYGELYDLESDPGEIVNLWDEPTAQALKAQLLDEIIDDLEALEKRGKRWCYA